MLDTITAKQEGFLRRENLLGCKYVFVALTSSMRIIMVAPYPHLQFRTRYFGQGKEIRQNWTGLEHFDICCCKLFDFYCQS